MTRFSAAKLTGLLVASLPLLFANNAQAGFGDLMTTYIAPGGGQPTGLGYYSGGLWMAEQSQNNIYKVNPNDGSLMATLPNPSWDGAAMNGVAYQKGYDGIWGHMSGRIYMTDVDAEYWGFDSSGNISSHQYTPDGTVDYGLAWDDVNDWMWAVDRGRNVLYAFSPDDFHSIVRTITAPSNDCWGLTFDGTYLWACDTGGQFYQIDTSNGSTVATFQCSEQCDLRGLGFDGYYLWAVDQGNNRLMKFDIGLKPPMTLSLGSDPIIGGQINSFTVAHGQSNAPTYLAYSLNGPGSTFIPALHVTCDLDHPKKGAGPTMTDSNGDLTWDLSIPDVSGLSIWIQALQDGEASNMVETTIE